MKTNRKILLTAIATSFLTLTTLSASCNMDGKPNRDGYGKGDKKEFHHKKDDSRLIIRMVKNLDLTKEQETKVEDILNNYFKNRNKIFSAFTNDGFDKDAYVKAKLNKKEQMIKAQATMIADVYKVLTKEQKIQLKEQLDKFNSSKPPFEKGQRDKEDRFYR